MAKINNLEDLQKDLESTWSVKMADFESRLKDVSMSSNPTLGQLKDDFQSFKEVVTSMLGILKQQVSECIGAVDEINMRYRQSSLLFHGVTENSECSLQEQVINIIQSKIGIADISCTSLSHCYRLGAKRNEHIQPILVKFHEQHVKSEVWKLKSKLKGSGIVISEFLTKPRQEIYKKARNHFGLKNVWTFDGSIYIKPPGFTREKVCTEVKLMALIDKFPSSNMSSTSVNAKSIDVSVKNVTNKLVQHSSSCDGRQIEPGRRKPSGTPLLDVDVKKSRRIASRK